MFTRTMQGEFLLSRYASDEISILTKKRTEWQSQDSTCSGLSLLLFLFYHVFFIIFIFYRAAQQEIDFALRVTTKTTYVNIWTQNILK